jgi:phosphoglycolate phosphatase
VTQAVLFWDIDGTLLTTGRAGIYAWQGALQAEIARDVDLTSFDTAGLPDPLIATRLLEEFGGGADVAAGLRLLRGYEERLPASLPRRAGRVLPNVREILEALSGRPDVYSMLLTGNTRAGASAKLRYYGLDRYFDGGAFSDDTEDRAGIARNALAEARRIRGELHPDRLYVIGDTPHDVAAGKAINARVVAVATGGVALSSLQALEPWWAIEQLPEPAIFLSRLSIAPVTEHGWIS